MDSDNAKKLEHRLRKRNGEREKADAPKNNNHKTDETSQENIVQNKQKKKRKLNEASNDAITDTGISKKAMDENVKIAKDPSKRQLKKEKAAIKQMQSRKSHAMQKALNYVSMIKSGANVERDNKFFRHVLLHYFDLKKNAAGAHQLLLDTYGTAAPSERTCRKWMQRFKKGDIEVRDKKRSGQPKKFDNEKLQELLDENPTQTLKELSVALGVDKSTISRRLPALGKIHKERK